MPDRPTLRSLTFTLWKHPDRRLPQCICVPKILSRSRLRGLPASATDTPPGSEFWLRRCRHGEPVSKARGSEMSAQNWVRFAKLHRARDHFGEPLRRSSNPSLVSQCLRASRSAAGRVGGGFCRDIQTSSGLSRSGCSRTITCSPFPIAGRPLFFGIIFS